MNQYRDAVISSEQMIILKKFDEAANYLYADFYPHGLGMRAGLIAKT